MKFFKIRNRCLNLLKHFLTEFTMKYELLDAFLTFTNHNRQQKLGYAEEFELMKPPCNLLTLIKLIKLVYK